MARRLVMINWHGRLRPRRDVMLELYHAGVPKAEIARRLGVIYQQVQMVVGPTKSGSAHGPGQRPTVSVPEIAGPSQTGRPSSRAADAVLVGCVDTKDTVPRPAKDLYQSPMFRGRRRHAEGSGKPWFVVSAEYGLVAPDEVIEPYDTRIEARPLAERQALAKQVADRLEQELGGLRGKVLELHAGEQYAEAIGPTLRSRGASMTRPLRGLAFGPQLSWYRERYGSLGGGSSVGTRSRVKGMSPKASPEVVPIGDGRGLAKRLTDAFMSGSLDLSGRAGAPVPGWPGMPEVAIAEELRRRGSDATALRCFLTFGASMDRLRDADRLAENELRLHAEHPWVFEMHAPSAYGCHDGRVRPFERSWE